MMRSGSVPKKGMTAAVLAAMTAFSLAQFDSSEVRAEDAAVSVDKKQKVSVQTAALPLQNDSAMREADKMSRIAEAIRKDLTFCIVLPDKTAVPLTDTTTKQNLNFVIGAIDARNGSNLEMEYPNAFSVACLSGSEEKRSEHLALLEENGKNRNAGWKASVPVTHAGMHQFILHTKPMWMEGQDRFLQFISRVQVPIGGSDVGWNLESSGFAVQPTVRISGLRSGMMFGGKIMRGGKSVSGALVKVAFLGKAPLQSKVKSNKSNAWPAFPTQELMADGDGRFSFVCPVSGWWLFSSSMDADPLKSPSGELKPRTICTNMLVYVAPLQ